MVGVNDIVFTQTKNMHLETEPCSGRPVSQQSTNQSIEDKKVLFSKRPES